MKLTPEEAITLEDAGKLSAEVYSDMLEAEFPSVIKKLYPRRILTPQGYYSAKYYAATSAPVFKLLTEGNRHQLSETDMTIAIQSYICVEHKIPTYYLSRNLAEALLNSKLPPNTSVEDLPRGRPTGVIMLPRDVIKTPEGESLAYLAYSFIVDGATSEIFHRYKLQIQGKDGIIMSSAEATGNKIMYGLCVDFGMTIKDVNENREVLVGEGINAPLIADEHDNSFNAKCFGLLCNILFLMESRPEIVQKSTLERKGKTKKGKTTDDLWTPQWIGQGYKSPSENIKPSDGTHTSPRMHWRQGHWRNQPFGSKDNPQIKMIWIDTVLINAPA